MMNKGSIQVLWKIEVRNPDGKLVKVKKGKSKSFVIAFLQQLQAITQHVFVGYADAIYIIDTGNTARLISGYNSFNNGAFFAVYAAAANTTTGIVVGTGSGAVENTNYKLGTQIAHGAGAGALNYGAMSYVATAVVGANVDLVYTRTFLNTSGATITINEIGMFSASADSNGGARYFCILRDLATQAVDNGQTATVTYTLRTTA